MKTGIWAVACVARGAPVQRTPALNFGIRQALQHAEPAQPAARVTWRDRRQTCRVGSLTRGPCHARLLRPPGACVISRGSGGRTRSFIDGLGQ